MRAFVVWFRDLTRWDPGSFHTINWHWPRSVLKPIGSLLRKKQIKVDRRTIPFSELQPITVHFDGSIEPRAIKGNRPYTMDMFFAGPGDIVVAKIDLKNGAVGIVPEGLCNVAVTSHFAVYQADRTTIVPEYLTLLIQCRDFKEFIWRNKVGAEGRKEVKLDFFESIEIPVPPLSIQEAIVVHDRLAQEEGRRARESAARLEQEVSRYVLKRLGISTDEVQRIRGPFIVFLKDLQRWSVDYHIKAMHSMATGHGSKFPLQRLGDLVDAKSGGTPSKNRTEYWNGGVAWVSPKDMKIDEILDAEDHITEIAVSENSLHLVPENSVLVVVRSGILQRTFPVGINRVPVTINQDMKALIPHGDLLPEYLVASLKAVEGKILKLVKHSTTVQSINSPDLMDLEIPLPPLPVQQEIVAHVKELRVKITALREGARQVEERAAREVEGMILGIRPVQKASA